jgi:hypothetical protein
VTLMTKAMAIDHAKAKVRVNAICPGQPTRRCYEGSDSRRNGCLCRDFSDGPHGTPEELAYAALFASDESSFVTGAMFAVDGGQTAGLKISFVARAQIFRYGFKFSFLQPMFSAKKPKRICSNPRVFVNQPQAVSKPSSTSRTTPPPGLTLWI